MNKELLLKVKEQILKEPKQFVMDSYFSEEPEIHGITIPNCGTAACIAGWAVVLSDGSNPKETKNKYMYRDQYTNMYVFTWTPEEGSLPRIAENLLGIEDSELLFQVDEWPREYQNKWNLASTPEERAAIAASLIDEVIDHDGIFWDNREEDEDY